MRPTFEQAKVILAKHTTEAHLFSHALAVSAAMGAMAEHYGEDPEAWRVLGYLHDVDYEKYPTEHCSHVAELLAPEGMDEADIRAICAHGYGSCSDVEPLSNLEKALFTVDELTGIVSAASLMRPEGITTLNLKSFMKKFKDRKFAAGCDRDVILRGCGMLGMEIQAVAEIVIRGMQAETDALGLGPREA